MAGQTRGRALRKRYGHSDSSFTIEESGGRFVIKLTRALGLRTGKEIPAGTTIGTINERGTISVSRPGGPNRQGYTEAARSLLNAARVNLKTAGRIMAKARARDDAEEQRSGSFIIKIDGGRTLRAHDMPSARAMTEKALLGMPVGTQAHFYRAGVGDRTTWSDGRPHTGAPWTEPFHVEETYEWNGQKKVGMARPKGGL